MLMLSGPGTIAPQGKRRLVLTHPSRLELKMPCACLLARLITEQCSFGGLWILPCEAGVDHRPFKGLALVASHPLECWNNPQEKGKRLISSLC